MDLVSLSWYDLSKNNIYSSFWGKRKGKHPGIKDWNK